MINLEEFGELISKQEWTAYKGNVEYFTYLGKNKTYAGNNYVAINGNRRKNCTFDCSVVVLGDESNDEIEFLATKIDSLSYLLSIADSVKTNGKDSIPINVFSYKNAKEKNDETFQVEINNIIFDIDKDNKLITDKKYFADEEDNSYPLNFIARYEFHDYGIYINEANESKSYLLNNENSCFPESSEIKLTNINQKSLNSSKIPNLNNLPEFIKFLNNKNEVFYSMSYDEYGLLKDSHCCLYEAYSFDEFEHPVFVASLHPFYFDNFDSEILPGNNKFCIEQVDKLIDEDEDVIIYSREIYEIKDEEKRIALEKLIAEAKNKNEPCIPIIK